MRMTWLAAGCVIGLAAASPGARAQGENFRDVAREAVKKSLPLLQKTAADWPERAGSGCWSCHHQTLPAMAMALARQQGYAVNETLIKEQASAAYAHFAAMRDLLVQGLTDPAAEQQALKRLIHAPMVAGFGLATLATADHPGDDVTAAVARFLAGRQHQDGRWAIYGARPPLESSEFTATALAIRALQRYLPPEHAKERNRRIARARAWLIAARPRTTEDKTFHLMGLYWAGAPKEALRKATRAVLAEQRDNGGWAQLPELPTDAYATGQVLVALHQGGGLPVTDPAYSRGSVYLVGTQHEDGSWLVPTRTAPFQPYFDSGFPHGKSQFISCAGSAWATMALALAAREKP
jgi:N-acyl-D-amino-acid deacylase